MSTEAFVVNQRVKLTIALGGVLNLPAGSLGIVVEVLPREVAVRFPGNNLVRVPEDSIKPA